MSELVFFCVFWSILLLFLWWAVRREKKKYSETQHKFSDAELFKMMMRANHFLTAEQLARISPLTVKEAKERFIYLSRYRVIDGYLNAHNIPIYRLHENVPLIEAASVDLDSLSEQEIVDEILLHVNDYQVTTAELVVIFDIDIYKAMALIKQLRKRGIISVLRGAFKHIYVVKAPIYQKQPRLRDRNRIRNTEKMAIPEQEKLKIPDSEIIQLAIDHDGKLTPTLLCLKKKISIDVAKQQLEELYEQGAFVMDVDKDNYVMEYHLRDKSLL